MKYQNIFPFSAIIGQEALKLALILNVINHRIGGVLIRGEKGTAKSTSVRALAALLPKIKIFAGCPFSCDPDDIDRLCDICLSRFEELQPVVRQKKVITLPLNATEDRVAGGIDFTQAVKKGNRMLQPGVLADAHRGILYVDEVNLLDDHIVDIILDAAASGENRIEREGISFNHPADFILTGTMNPEEGDLRPQLLDRFGLCVEVSAEKDPDLRILMMERREAFDLAPEAFLDKFKYENKKIYNRIKSAREMLKAVRLPKFLRTLITEICTENNVAGHRADLIIEQAARAHAAWFQKKEVSVEDIQAVAGMALLHRKRDAAPPPPPPPPPEENSEESSENSEDNTRENETQQQEEKQESQQLENSDTEETLPLDEENTEPETDQEEKDQTSREDVLEQIFDVG